MYKIYGLRIIGEDEMRYIGITKQKLHYRFRQHKNDFRRNPHKTRWLNKNKDKVEMILLEDNIENLPSANEKEMEFISFYKKAGCRLLNATDGGDGTAGFVSWNKGVSCTYKEKLITNSPRARKIICYDLEGNFIELYRSIKYASKCTGLSRQDIYGSLIGKKGQKRAGFFQFKYHTIGFPEKTDPIISVKRGRVITCIETNEKFTSISAAASAFEVGVTKMRSTLTNYRFSLNGLKDQKRTPIVCIETNETFQSITQASAKMNIHKGNIGEVLIGKRKTAGGLTFKYLS